MVEKIKVKLNNFTGEYSDDSMYFKKYFPIRVLIENFNVEFVDNEKDAEIIFEQCTRSSNYNFLNEKKRKVVLLCGEDIYKKRDIFNLIESFFHKIGFKKKKWIIMDKIDSILPDFISSKEIVPFLPRHLEFIKKIARGKVKNAYAIVQNDIQGKNILILPSFFYTLYYDLPKLVKKKRFKKKNKFCAFIVSSNSSRERVKFFKELSKYKRVDSYGRVQNNMGDSIFNTHWDKNYNLLKKYKFVIAFENNFAKEYICEKIFKPMLSDSIPIYRGAPNIGDYLNINSFINFDNYGSNQAVIQKVIELDQDDEKYKKMFAEPWFVENKIPGIIEKKEKELIKFYKKIIEN